MPGSPDEYYGVTDRGPNVSAPDGKKVEPLPSFQPSIAKLKLHDGLADVEQVIGLKATDGSPYNGHANTDNPTPETLVDLNGTIIPPDANGYDPEGLVALSDGTFWVSDEYGPFITHFAATGTLIGRLSPFGGGLPAELRYRVPNKGMEGLTITPDGTTLVGMMQSALQAPDLPTTFDPTKIEPLRIVTYKPATRSSGRSTSAGPPTSGRPPPSPAAPTTVWLAAC